MNIKVIIKINDKVLLFIPCFENDNAWILLECNDNTNKIYSILQKIFKSINLSLNFKEDNIYYYNNQIIYLYSIEYEEINNIKINENEYSSFRFFNVSDILKGYVDINIENYKIIQKFFE